MAAKKKVANKASAKKLNDAKDGTWCAFFQYLFPIGLVWWLVDENMKKNVFATFHLKQALVLDITHVLIGVAGSILFFLDKVIYSVGGLFIFVL
ncbi:hypothetical protein GOV10_04875, partial [Candidatus Woesearchaeota archaeon]|nr:hypothetical protein [Candidatus Woesearchaeota archaeon]